MEYNRASVIVVLSKRYTSAVVRLVYSALSEVLYSFAAIVCSHFAMFSSTTDAKISEIICECLCY